MRKKRKYGGSCACMLSLCDPVDCSPPGSSVHWILQARILEGVTISSSRGSCWPRDGTYTSCVSCVGRQVLHHWAIWAAADTWWQLIVYYPPTSSLHFFAVWSWDWTCKPCPLASWCVVGRGTRETLWAVWLCHSTGCPLALCASHAPPVPASPIPCLDDWPSYILAEGPSEWPVLSKGWWMPQCWFPW